MFRNFKDKFFSDNNLVELLKGSTITFILKIIGMLLSYCVAIFISNKYGAEGIGLYNLSFRIITSLGIVCALGFNISVLRYVGEFNVKKDRGAYLKKIINYSFQLSFPFSLLIGVLLFFFSEEIALNIFENGNYSQSIKIIAAVLPFFTLNLINVEFIRGLKLLKVSEYLRSVNTYLIILTILFLAILDFELLNSIYAIAIGIVSTFIISLLFIYNHLKGFENKTKQVSFFKKEFIGTSLPMMIITTSSFVLAFSGIFFLELFSTTNIVGVYSICIMLSQFVSLALTVVNTISAPKFSELYWNNKKVELKKVLSHSSKLIFWTSLFVSIILLIFSEQILSFFGNEFISGKKALIILILGQIVNAITGSVGIFLNMTGNQKVLRNIILFTAIVVVLGYFVIIPKHGMLGAAITSVFGTIILNVTSAVYVYKKLRYVTFYLPFLKFKND